MTKLELENSKLIIIFIRSVIRSNADFDAFLFLIITWIYSYIEHEINLIIVLLLQHLEVVI